MGLTYAFPQCGSNDSLLNLDFATCQARYQRPESTSRNPPELQRAGVHAVRRAHRRAYAPHLVPEVQHDDLPYPAATPQSILVEKRCVFEVISPPHLPGIFGECRP